MATLYRQDKGETATGTVFDFHIEDKIAPEGGYKLEDLYRLLGCNTVQVIYLADGRLMWIDDNGKFDSSNLANPIPTKLLSRAGGIPGDWIAGSALVCKESEMASG